MKRAVISLAAVLSVLFLPLCVPAQTLLDSLFDPGPPAPPSRVAARQHYFGVENVDPVTGNVRKDRVIFSWFSNTSLAVALKGRVVLLDAFINNRQDTPGRTPTTLNELVALKPEAIFIGHGHFDHAELAGYIAAVTGATIVGAPEHCDMARGDAQAVLGPTATVNCVEAVSRSSAPGAEVNALEVLKPDACITVFKHVHSGVAAPDPTNPPNPVEPIPDPRDPVLFPPGPGPSDGVSSSGDGAAGALSLFYQFRVNHDNSFTFVWHDTVGLKEQAGPLSLYDIMRALPLTDIHFGSIVSLGFATNGVRDIALYINAVEPKIFAPLHHDVVSPQSSSPFWKLAVEREFANHPDFHRPQLPWLYDHYDYLRPELFTIDYKAPHWRKDADPLRPSGQCNWGV
ncbi:MAG: MBL fold metallo-hydrolase [Candidatus Rokubacteria bacterium]|nr:MBL fold metallo-hydrolase [Candidatus Rokubacteria bacterium]